MGRQLLIRGTKVFMGSQEGKVEKDSLRTRIIFMIIIITALCTQAKLLTLRDYIHKH